MSADETIYIIEAEMRRSYDRLKKIEKKAELTEAEKIRIGEVTNYNKHVKRLIEVYQRDRSIAFGRIPPHDLELEKVILGTLILHCKPPEPGKLNSNPSLAAWESLQRIKGLLRPDHFYSEVHGLIYKVVQSLEQPDGRSVYERLRKEGLSEKCGGLAYIAGLTGLVVNALQEQNALILIQFAIKRKLIMVGANLMEGSYNDGADALECLEGAISEINGVQAWIK